jgi:hypothetical protein
MNAQAIELDQIRGNTLAGFNKDFASFLFFVLPADPAQARRWVAQIVDEVATTAEVKAFNDLFRVVRAPSPPRSRRGYVDEHRVHAFWR